MPLTDTVDQYIQTLEAESRRVSETEWGLTVEAAGWPLHIGIAWRDGLLRAQAEVLGPDQLTDHELLFRNRGLVLVRYAHTSAGDVYVHGELPSELVVRRRGSTGCSGCWSTPPSSRGTALRARGRARRRRARARRRADASSSGSRRHSRALEREALPAVVLERLPVAVEREAVDLDDDVCSGQ